MLDKVPTLTLFSNGAWFYLTSYEFSEYKVGGWVQILAPL